MSLLAPARRWLDRDVPALPVDVFRILVGLLAATHFVRLLVEAPEISAPDGLIDHGLMQDVYWYTRIGLFQPGMPGWVFPLTYAVGLGASALLILGVRVRLAALVALVIAASAYRWNFIVMYLDDAVVHLTLFWMLLLPAGRTLTLAGLRDPAARAAWRTVRVSGVAVRCLLVNVCWIYFIAGVWKLDSELWREGFGLYASMKVGIARMPDVWTPAHLPMLRVADWAVMALEPVLALPLLLRRGHPLKWIGAAGFLVFNLFIAGTLGITWAICGLTATLVLFFAEEVGAWLNGGAALPLAPAVPGERRRWSRSEVGAVVFLALVMSATARHIRAFGALNEPAYAALWMVGVGQDYRLFNWIDRVAFQVRTEARVTRPDGSPGALPPDALPSGFRALLLRGYAHDVRWLMIPEGRTFDLRLAIARRQASWACRYVDEPGTIVDVVSTVHPIRPDNLALAATRRVRIAEFRCVSPGTVSEREGGVPVPAEWPYLQAQLLSGVLELRL